MSHCTCSSSPDPPPISWATPHARPFTKSICTHSPVFSILDPLV